MPRHNREASGSDQHGAEYVIAYQPDWLYQVRITRDLENGRQSTKTLFRNPDVSVQQQPGSRVRTRVQCAEHHLDFELTLEDPRGVVRRVIVETELPDGRRARDVAFAIEHRPGRTQR